MHPRDIVAEAAWPVVLARHGEPLSVPPVGTRRLVIAGSGLWLDARSAALHIRLPLSALDTPYGPLARIVRGCHGAIGGRVWTALFDRAAAAHPSETALLVVADDDGYRVIAPRLLTASGHHVTYDDSGIDPDRLLLDVHTHGQHPAFFSAQDDASDAARPGPHLSLVIGTCATPGAAGAVLRACCAPYFIDLPLTALRDDT